MVSSDEAEKLTIAATRLYSVQEAAGRLQSLLPRTPGWAELSAFLPANLSQPLDRRSAVASHFVASLELAKDGVVALRQSSLCPAFHPIKGVSQMNIQLIYPKLMLFRLLASSKPLYLHRQRLFLLNLFCL